MILHPIHIITLAIRNGKKYASVPPSSLPMPPPGSHLEAPLPQATPVNCANYLIPFLRQAMWYDVRRSMDRDLAMIQKQLVQNFFQNKSWRGMDDQQSQYQLFNQGSLLAVTQQTILRNIKLSVTEEQKVVQRCIPHFTIRMLGKLEVLLEEGVLSQAEFDQWVDPDLYKEISKILQQVVHAFKLTICSDKAMNSAINKLISTPIQTNGMPNLGNLKGLAAAHAQAESALQKAAFETFIDLEFKDEMTDFKLRQISQDCWMKESIMLAVRSISGRMKRYMGKEDILMTFSHLKLVFKSFYFDSMKTCDFILDKSYEVIKYIIEDQPDQIVRLNVKEKLGLLSRLISMTPHKPKDQPLSSNHREANSITNRVCTLFLDFMEEQTNVLTNELFLRQYDRLFQLNVQCSFEIRQRHFALFEKFFGSSLKAKIVYFFNKLSLVNKPGQDNFDTYKESASLKDLLEFTLYNFNEDVTLQQIKNSTTLCPLSDRDGVELQDAHLIMQSQDGLRSLDALRPFYAKYQKYVKKQSSLKQLMQPLAEIIRINPEHNIQDKNIAEKIFSKVFWQMWQILDRPDQQYLSEAFNKVFLNFIRFTSMLQGMPHIKQQFARTLIEQIASLKEPQCRIEPEVLQYIGKHFNLWHVSIPLLEDQVALYGRNERYVHALQELYSGLMEEDYSVGLSRVVTRSAEMRSLYTFSQHHQWEQINSLFGQYINFYAEQEGLLMFLEQAQDMPGKYSRQLAKSQLVEMVQAHSYDMVFEKNPEIATKLNNRKFPRPGGNRNISDIDLRSWENLYLTSLKVLKRNDIFKDVAENMNRFELRIEHQWQKKECRYLIDYLSRVLQQNQSQSNANNLQFIMPNSFLQRVKYHMYYSFVLSEQIVETRVNPEDDRSIRHKLDDNYHQTQSLALKQITDNLPSYIDSVQNEYFILFQQILESQEGICNMLLEYDRRNLNDLRNMMNIWRERLPHKCETIQTWQDVLENRRFIFQLLLSKNQRQLQQQRAAMQGAGSSQQPAQSQLNAGGPSASQAFAGKGNTELSFLDKRKLLEQVDIVWINLKLAEVSRKHGMPNLAEHYQDLTKQWFAGDVHKAGAPTMSGGGDTFKLEHFKQVYERFKLKMQYCSEEVTQHDCLTDTQAQAVSPEFLPWQQAELLRIIGEHYLSKGKIHQANEYLLHSIDKNKREAKTWLAYAKLNDTLFQRLKEEKSALNCLKGYFCAITLCQHKARLIIPRVFKLLKQKSILDVERARQWQQQKQAQTATPATGAPGTTAQAGAPPSQQAGPTPASGTNAQGAPVRRAVPGQQPGAPGTAPSQGVPKTVPGQKLDFLVSKGVARDMPKWIWIFWLPQILQFLTLPKDDTLHQMSKVICHYLCVLYPQATWYPLKATSEYQRDTQSQNQIYEFFCRKIIENMNKKLYTHMLQVMKELHQISRASNDEKLLATLKRCLSFSDQLQQKSKAEGLLKNFLKQIYDRGVINEQPEAKAEWERLILNEETREKRQLEQIKIIKNIKDYLLIQSNMREQDIYLQEESPYLASFPQRGIELPGQYVLKEGEPRPENVIIIERMGPTIQRNGHKEKKINFRCTNGKCYYFTTSTFASKEFKAQLQHERVTQLKVVANMILKRHKESARRGLKFYAAPQVFTHYKPPQLSRQSAAQGQPSTYNRLVQDDKTFGDLQETHDYLLQERGLDPDMALLLQVQHVQDIYAGKPESEREFARITESQIQQLNRQCYAEMRKEVKPHLLSSYFHRIFSNVDNMFIFKKQFTKYHALNSFFTYVFNQADKQELGSLSFCKATGQINVQYANLRHALHLYKDVFQAAHQDIKLNFKELESNIFRVPIKPINPSASASSGEAAANEVAVELDEAATVTTSGPQQRQQKVDFYVPFRITPNIEHFIGQIGIQGLFAGVMTSASLAMSAHADKSAVLIELLLSEELRDFKNQTQSGGGGGQQSSDPVALQRQFEAETKRHADFCMFKIQSLSEHSRIIEQPPKSEESKAGEPKVRAPNVDYNPQTGTYILGNNKWQVPKEFLDLEMDRPDIPEEFNKKVFTLIEMATDDTRRCQKSLTWCPWF